MLENFREIYDRELENRCEESSLGQLILDSQDVRMFVYEVCKECLKEAGVE